ncbi:transposase [Caballeronia sp. LZ025]|nr:MULTISPECIES: IS66 family transposase [Caballeronia]MDR5736207.1 transposase [Caballeronia sp. LZ025]
MIHGDETTVQVLKEPGKAAQSTSYMWVYRIRATSGRISAAM